MSLLILLPLTVLPIYAEENISFDNRKGAIIGVGPSPGGSSGRGCDPSRPDCEDNSCELACVVCYCAVACVVCVAAAVSVVSLVSLFSVCGIVSISLCWICLGFSVFFIYVLYRRKRRSNRSLIVSTSSVSTY